MDYVIGIGGLAGTLMLYWAIADINYMVPRWRRYILGLIGVALMVMFWIVQPIWVHHGGSLLPDCWDGRSNAC